MQRSRKDLSQVAEQNQEVYAKLLETQDQLVAFTLEDLRVAALQIAKHSGLRQERKVQAWIDERLKGEADFLQGMDETADIRERAAAGRSVSISEMLMNIVRGQRLMESRGPGRRL